jgi:hypothetical protein
MPTVGSQKTGYSSYLTWYVLPCHSQDFHSDLFVGWRQREKVGDESLKFWGLSLCVFRLLGTLRSGLVILLLNSWRKETPRNMRCIRQPQIPKGGSLGLWCRWKREERNPYRIVRGKKRLREIRSSSIVAGFVGNFPRTFCLGSRQSFLSPLVPERMCGRTRKQCIWR